MRNQKGSNMDKNRDSIPNISDSATTMSREEELAVLIDKKHRRPRYGGTGERDLCETMSRSRQRLPGKMRKHRCPSPYLCKPAWLRSVLSRTGHPSAAARDNRRKIALFVSHLRRRRCALSWLTAIQYVSNIILSVTCRLRAFGAAW